MCLTNCKRMDIGCSVRVGAASVVYHHPHVVVTQTAEPALPRHPTRADGILTAPRRTTWAPKCCIQCWHAVVARGASGSTHFATRKPRTCMHGKHEHPKLHPILARQIGRANKQGSSVPPSTTALPACHCTMLQGHFGLGHRARAP
jgi:hypothetical protein